MTKEQQRRPRSTRRSRVVHRLRRGARALRRRARPRPCQRSCRRQRPNAGRAGELDSCTEVCARTQPSACGCGGICIARVPTPRGGLDSGAMTAAEIRERSCRSSRSADHLRDALGVARAAARTTRRCCSPPRACSRSSRTSAAQEDAAASAADLLPEVLPHDRHRRGRADRAPPDVLRDARQLLVRRLLQAGRGRVRLGAVDAGLRARPASGSGSPSSAATRSSASAPTRRRSSAGARSACRDERIVQLGRDGQLLAGRARPGRAGPCSELYSTAGSDFGGDDDRPGDDTERFLEFWNLVFMQYELHEDGSLDAAAERRTSTPAWASTAWRRSCRTSPSVFETDQFRPLVELGEELSGRTLRRGRRRRRARCASSPTTAAAMTFLIADGVVPSNEDRGYVLRRIMRRAIQQGRALGIEPAVPGRFAERRDRDDGRRLPRAARASATRSTSGSTPRRRASAARSSRARGCCARLIARAQARRGRRGSPPRTRSACTTPTASRTT